MPRHANSSARILDAALTLFSEKGYEPTSTRAICEMAGITKPTLYYFYASKEGVYGALIRSAMQQFAERIERIMAEPGTLRERLKRLAERVFQDARRQPRLLRFLFAVVYSVHTPLAAEVHRPYKEMARRIAAELERATRAGEIGPGDVPARVLVVMGALAESLSNFLVMGEPRLTRRLAHSIIDTIFDGWQQPNRRAGKS